MTSRERRTLNALNAIQGSCKKLRSTPVLELPPQFMAKVAEYEALMSRLATASPRKGRNRSQIAASLRASVLDKLLNEYLRPMRQMARRHAFYEPGFEVPFVVPRPRSTMQAVLEGTRIFIEEAAPHQELFVGYGMKPGFLDELRDVGNLLEAHMQEVRAVRSDEVVTGKEFRRLLQETRGVAWQLDTFLRLHFRRIVSSTAHSEEQLREIRSAIAGAEEYWEQSFHIERDPVRQPQRLRPVL